MGRVSEAVSDALISGASGAPTAATPPNDGRRRKQTDPVPKKREAPKAKAKKIANPPKRKPGRPKTKPERKTTGHKAPRSKVDRRVLAINWKVIETEYIGGYFEANPTDGVPRRVWPSFSDLADRHRVNLGTIGYQAKQRNWVDRRTKVREQLQHQWDSELLKAREHVMVEGALTLDRFVDQFAAAVKADAVPRMTIADLERALKLRLWLEDERAGTSAAGIDLTELQARHKKAREQAREIDSLTAGLMPSRETREQETLSAVLPDAWAIALHMAERAASNPIDSMAWGA